MCDSIRFRSILNVLYDACLAEGGDGWVMWITDERWLDLIYREAEFLNERCGNRFDIVRDNEKMFQLVYEQEAIIITSLPIKEENRKFYELILEY